MIRTLFVLVSISCLLNAQNTAMKVLKKNAVSLKSTYTAGVFKDLNYSPLNYHSGAFGVDIGYFHYSDSSKYFFGGNIAAQSGRLTSDYSELFTSSSYAGYFEIFLLRKLPSNSFAGFKIATTAHYADFLGYSFGYLLNYSFSVGYRKECQNIYDSKHSVSASCYVSLINFIVRPPYNGFDKNLEEVVFTEMIDLLNDGHTNLWNPNDGWQHTSNNLLNEQAEEEFSKQLVCNKYMENADSSFEEGAILYGDIKGTNIGDFAGDNPSWIWHVLKKMKNKDALVFDLRNNDGGDDTYAANIA